MNELFLCICFVGNGDKIRIFDLLHLVIPPIPPSFSRRVYSPTHCTRNITYQQKKPPITPQHSSPHLRTAPKSSPIRKKKPPITPQHLSSHLHTASESSPTRKNLPSPLNTHRRTYTLHQNDHLSEKKNKPPHHPLTLIAAPTHCI